jgi:hypothetical protein
LLSSDASTSSVTLRDALDPETRDLIRAEARQARP